jgi:hypothetical protein
MRAQRLSRVERHSPPVLQRCTPCSGSAASANGFSFGPPGGEDQAPPGNHTPGRVDDDRQNEAPFVEAPRQFSDLPGRMFPRLPPEVTEAHHCDKPWVQIARNGIAIRALTFYDWACSCAVRWRSTDVQPRWSKL